MMMMMMTLLGDRNTEAAESALKLAEIIVDK